MPTKPHSSIFIALLRGINVGGSGIIKMTELKKMFESLGFANVVTYIQSGNVLFETNDNNDKRIASLIEKKLEETLKHPIKVFLFTPAQLKKAARLLGRICNPGRSKMVGIANSDQQNYDQHCHLMFLSAKPDEACIKALMGMQGEDYKFFIDGEVLYYSYPKSLGGKRRTINFEKVLMVTGTARTWKVVNKLIELAGKSSKFEV